MRSLTSVLVGPNMRLGPPRLPCRKQIVADQGGEQAARAGSGHISTKHASIEVIAFLSYLGVGVKLVDKL